MKKLLPKIKSMLSSIALMSPILTSMIVIISLYLFSQYIYAQLHCNTLELDQLRNLCSGNFAPGPPDDCEIFPACVSDKASAKFNNLSYLVLGNLSFVFWFLLHLIKRKKIKFLKSDN